VSQERVLFGGISVYLEQYVPFFRKTPRFLDRLWDAPRVISALAGRAVSNDPKLLGELTLSMLRGPDGPLGKEFRKLRAWLGNEPPPDVVNLPNSLLISLADPLRRWLDRPVVCTLQGEELFIDGLASPYREHALEAIRIQVPQVDRFVAVSEYCREFMAGYLEIPEDRISVVPLGIHMGGYSQRGPHTSDGPFRLGYFARIAPEKGLHLLAEAFLRLRERGGTREGRRFELHAAGYASPDNAAYLESVRARLDAAGCLDQFHYHGVLDREGKLAFLRSLDVLSVPATYDEPKGLFLIEAMANGVPVVQPRRGAFTEIVERTGGGWLVPPDDPAALAEAIGRLASDPAEASRLGACAFEGSRAHYGVEQAAARLVEVYREVSRTGGGSGRKPAARGVEA
jgi:glycosyltransferase involved in cell wall biosynthesis